MSLNIVLELLRGMLAGKGVGVIAIGQEQHLDIHTLLQQHIGTTHSGMDTSLIAIVKQHDVLREASQQLNLVYTQRRTRVSHHILQSALVHGNNIGIAFNHVYAVFLDNGLLGLIDAVKLAFLVIDL